MSDFSARNPDPLRLCVLMLAMLRHANAEYAYPESPTLLEIEQHIQEIREAREARRNPDTPGYLPI